MKQIEVFVDSVYQNVGGNKKEIQELKAEMKNHLLEAVHELKAEGKSDREAIEIAIERFGGEKELRSVIGELFKVQKTFAKWILYTGFAILFITALLFSVFINIGNQNESEQSDIAYQIGGIVASQDKISSTQEVEMQTLVNNTDYISNVKVYKVAELNREGGNLNNETPNYEYRRDLTGFSNLLLNSYYYGAEGSWVSLEIMDYRFLSFIVLFVGFTSYWVLFSIWAIINTYHQKRLNIGWTLAFILFNVLGYLVFKISKRFRSVFSTERVL